MQELLSNKWFITNSSSQGWTGHFDTTSPSVLGDHSDLIIWLVIMAVVIIAIIVILCLYKKKTNKTK